MKVRMLGRAEAGVFGYVNQYRSRTPSRIQDSHVSAAAHVDPGAWRDDAARASAAGRCGNELPVYLRPVPGTAAGRLGQCGFRSAVQTEPRHRSRTQWARQFRTGSHVHDRSDPTGRPRLPSWRRTIVAKMIYSETCALDQAGSRQECETLRRTRGHPRPVAGWQG